MSKVLKFQEVLMSQEVLALSEITDPEDLNCPDSQPENREAGDGAVDPREQQLADERQSILALAEKEAQTILGQAEAQSQTIQQQAYEAGYREGGAAKLKDIENCIATLDQTVVELTEAVGRYMAEYEENLHWLAVDVAAKIIYKTLEADHAALLELIKHAVGSVKKAGWIEVVISDKLSSQLAILQGQLESMKGMEAVSFILKDVPLGTCLVETPNGVIDASVHTQIENLKACFRQVDPSWGG